MYLSGLKNSVLFNDTLSFEIAWQSPKVETSFMVNLITKYFLDCNTRVAMTIQITGAPH